MSDGRTITMTELRALIKEEKIKPSELFETEILVKDPIVQAEVEKAIRIDESYREFKDKNDASYIPDDFSSETPSKESDDKGDDSGEADYIPD